MEEYAKLTVEELCLKLESVLTEETIAVFKSE